MTLAAGTRLGPYTIEQALGSGGMGEVYRAKDTRLGRSVAIKVLPAHVSGNPARRDRLAREARAVSRLSHPHICPIYDVGEQDGCQFLVMEYLEGEPLSRRLQRGALPAAEVTRYAREMADALDHAHRHGVVHRDLKPANIMLTRGGARLVDFGLARLERADVAATSASVAGPPLTESLTEEGTILGTTRYMAPEQLEGGPVDARTDIFALGAVMYEMATARPAFDGSTKASIIAAVLERTPQTLSMVRAAITDDLTPPLLDEIVSRCLAKNPDERWQTASDLKQALTWTATGAAGGVAPALASRRRRLRYLAGAGAGAASIAILLSAILLWNGGAGRRDDRLLRYTVPAPEGTTLNPASAFMAVSPDGAHLAFIASSLKGGRALWVLSRDSTVARQLRGTVGAFQPFWSPDSRFVAFGTDDGILKKVDVATGLSENLASAYTHVGDWNKYGVVLFPIARSDSRFAHLGLYSVESSGGNPKPVTAPDPTRAEYHHLAPHFLPDGRRFLFLARSRNVRYDGMIWIGSLDAGEPLPLFPNASQAVYASGHLLFVREQMLVAQKFDSAGLRVIGEQIPLVDNVESGPGGRAAFSVSSNGVLAFRSTGRTELVWFDRNGRSIGPVVEPGNYANPSLSPDEHQIAVERQDPLTGQSSVWIVDLTRRGLQSKLTEGAGPTGLRVSAGKPLWSRDGTRVVYLTGESFAAKHASGSGPEERILDNVSPFDSPLGWSADGKMLVYSALDSQAGARLWMVPFAGGEKPVSIPNSGSDVRELQGHVSPDGRWLAYVSNESGRFDVYIRSFPSGHGKTLISTDGGIEPTWRGDSRELFYLAPDRSIMAVKIGATPTFQASTPARLFETKLSTVMNVTLTRNQYAVSGDGQRFLINHPTGEATPITVIVNWTALLRK